MEPKNYRRNRTIPQDDLSLYIAIYRPQRLSDKQMT